MKRTLIKNGRVVDPKQNIDEIINVYIEDGVICALTHDEPEADVILDVPGKIVSPGFIDMHMHEDHFSDDSQTALRIEDGLAALHMGVTTDIGGNCGSNRGNPLYFMDLVDRDGAPVNIALLAGHSWLRNHKGTVNKYEPVSDQAIADMAAECEALLDGGCLGVSFGVKYIPGTTWEEIMALVKLCRKDDKIVSSHVRMDVDGVFDAAAELAQMGREGGVKVQFSHIGSMGGYGQMKQLLADIEGYRADGIDMMCDCYPYNAFSTSIGATTYDDGFLESYQSDYDSILIVGGKYDGQRCTKEIFEELRATAPDTDTIGYFMNGEDVEMALKHPLIMLGSDGGLDLGKGHPRSSGTFAKFLHDYVATGKISLMDGIAKVSTMAAERLNLPKKGNLMPGSDADITIFDLEKVKDNATFEQADLFSEGFTYVLIGGEIALKDDQAVNLRLGRSVRR